MRDGCLRLHSTSLLHLMPTAACLSSLLTSFVPVGKLRSSTIDDEGGGWGDYLLFRCLDCMLHAPLPITVISFHTSIYQLPLLPFRTQAVLIIVATCIKVFINFRRGKTKNKAEKRDPKFHDFKISNYPNEIFRHIMSLLNLGYRKDGIPRLRFNKIKLTNITKYSFHASEKRGMLSASQINIFYGF